MNSVRCALFLLLVSVGLVCADEAVFIENFDYAAGILTNVSAGTSNQWAKSGGSNGIAVVDGNLIYAGYKADGRMVQMGATKEDDHCFITTNLTTAYMSLLLNVQSFNTGSYGTIAMLKDGGESGKKVYRLITKGDTDNNTYSVGIGTDSGAAKIYHPVILNTGTTYKITVSFIFGDDISNNVYKLWINEDNLTETAGDIAWTGEVAGTEIDYVALYQADAWEDGAADYYIDAIRVGASWSSVYVTPIANPKMSIVYPETNPFYADHAVSNIIIRGTSDTNTSGIISWTNVLGDSGQFDYTPEWSFMVDTLSVGTNIITIMATNAAGGEITETVEIVREDAPPILDAVTIIEPAHGEAWVLNSVTNFTVTGQVSTNVTLLQWSNILDHSYGDIALTDTNWSFDMTLEEGKNARMVMGQTANADVYAYDDTREYSSANISGWYSSFRPKLGMERSVDIVDGNPGDVHAKCQPIISNYTDEAVTSFLDCEFLNQLWNEGLSSNIRYCALSTGYPHMQPGDIYSATMICGYPQPTQRMGLGVMDATTNEVWSIFATGQNGGEYAYADAEGTHSTGIKWTSTTAIRFYMTVTGSRTYKMDVISSKGDIYSGSGTFVDTGRATRYPSMFEMFNINTSTNVGGPVFYSRFAFTKGTVVTPLSIERLAAISGIRILEPASPGPYTWSSDSNTVFVTGGCASQVDTNIPLAWTLSNDEGGATNGTTTAGTAWTFDSELPQGTNIITVTACAAGNTFFSGSDNASNYTGGWQQDDNEGSGFDAWYFSNNPDSGYEIKSSKGCGAQVDIDRDGKAFSMYGYNGQYAHATRMLHSPLTEGSSFQFRLGMNYNNGAKGFNLLSPDGTELINFNKAADETWENKTDASGAQNTGWINSGAGYNYLITVTQTTATAVQFSVERSDSTGTQSISTNLEIGTLIGGVTFYCGGGDNASDTYRLFINELDLKQTRVSDSVTVIREYIAPPVIAFTSSSLTVGYDITNITLNGTANTNVLGMVWTNTLTTAGGALAVTTNWQISAASLDVGTNLFTVEGTNYLGRKASDSIGIIRLDHPELSLNSPAPAFSYVDTDIALITASGTAGNITNGVVWNNTSTSSNGQFAVNEGRWSGDIPLAEGENILVFSVGQGIGLTTVTTTVTRFNPAVDFIIVSPTNGTVYPNSVADATLSGSHSNAASMTWVNETTTNSGNIVMGDTWNASVPLSDGTNQLTVTARGAPEWIWATAHDEAGNYSQWSDGSDSGTGWNTDWQISTHPDKGSAGTFLGDSRGMGNGLNINSSNGKAFGLYAHSSDDASVDVGRVLSDPLTAGRFSMDMLLKRYDTGTRQLSLLAENSNTVAALRWITNTVEISWDGTHFTDTLLPTISTTTLFHVELNRSDAGLMTARIVDNNAGEFITTNALPSEVPHRFSLMMRGLSAEAQSDLMFNNIWVTHQTLSKSLYVFHRDASYPELTVANPSTTTVDTDVTEITLTGTVINAETLIWSNALNGTTRSIGPATNWSGVVTPLTYGSNLIHVIATSTNGMQDTKSLMAVRLAPLPELAITDPVLATNIMWSTTNYTVSGSCNSNLVMMGSIRWSNLLTGAAASFSPMTTNWQVDAIALKEGTNTLVFTAQNGTGQQDEEQVHIIRAARSALPNITIISPTDGQAYSNEAAIVCFTGECTSAQSSVIQWTNLFNGASGITTNSADQRWSFDCTNDVGYNRIWLTTTNADWNTYEPVVDSASSYTSDTWSNNANLGSGFGPWSLTAYNNDGGAGRYIATAAEHPELLIPHTSFALWSYGGGTMVADRPMTNTLEEGGTLSLFWQTPPANEGGSMGLSFQDAASNTVIECLRVAQNEYYQLRLGTNELVDTTISALSSDYLELTVKHMEPGHLVFEIHQMGTDAMQSVDVMTDDSISRLHFWNGIAGDDHDMFFAEPRITRAPGFKARTVIRNAGLPVFTMTDPITNSVTSVPFDTDVQAVYGEVNSWAAGQLQWINQHDDDTMSHGFYDITQLSIVISNVALAVGTNDVRIVVTNTTGQSMTNIFTVIRSDATPAIAITNPADGVVYLANTSSVLTISGTNVASATALQVTYGASEKPVISTGTTWVIDQNTIVGSNIFTIVANSKTGLTSTDSVVIVRYAPSVNGFTVSAPSSSPLDVPLETTNYVIKGQGYNLAKTHSVSWTLITRDGVVTNGSVDTSSTEWAFDAPIYWGSNDFDITGWNADQLPEFCATGHVTIIRPFPEISHFAITNPVENTWFEMKTETISVQGTITNVARGSDMTLSRTAFDGSSTSATTDAANAWSFNNVSLGFGTNEIIVTAYDEKGGSQSVTTHVYRADATPALTILSPADRASYPYITTQVVVSGTAAAGIESFNNIMWINHTTMQMGSIPADQTTWEAPVDLAEGTNLFTIVEMNRARVFVCREIRIERRAPPCKGLIISKYISGLTDNQKMIVLKNGGSTSIAAGRLFMTFYMYTNVVSGTLQSYGNAILHDIPAGASLAIIPTDADPFVKALASQYDATEMMDSMYWFRGMDCVVLKKIITADDTYPDDIIDSLGQINNLVNGLVIPTNPEWGWGTAENNTRYHILTRHPYIQTGRLRVWDPFDPSQEWSFSALNTCRVYDIDVDPAHVMLSYFAPSNGLYTLQRTENLNGGIWESLTSVTATGIVGTVTVSNDVPMAFFRLE